MKSIFISGMVQTPAMNEFRRPDTTSSSEASLTYHKYFSQPLFGMGQIILEPKGEKGRQKVHGDVMVCTEYHFVYE